MRTLRLAMLAALTLAVAACSDDDNPGRPSRVTILFTTDEHSHLFAFGNEGADWPLPTTAGDDSLKGGVARRATIFANERLAATQRGGDSVVVSSGDFSHGTLAGVAFVPQNTDPANPETGNPDLGIMYALGYDVAAIGNHEFDWGPAALAGAVHPSSLLGQTPPLVLTNVVFDDTSSADDSLAALYGERGSGKPITRSRVTTTIRGIRVGFVSSMGFDAAQAAFVAAPVRFADASATTRTSFLASAAAMIQAEVDSLRAEGVDAVVLLGHGGIKESVGGGDDELLVPLLSGIDLVLAGHTHLQSDVRLLKDADDRDVPLVAAPAYGRAVGRVELTLSGGRAALVADRTAFVPVDSRTVPLAAGPIPGILQRVIAGVEAAFLPGTLSLIENAPVTDDPADAGDLYFRRLCSSSFGVTGVASGETNGLNLDTDAMLTVANALLDPTVDVALQASGAIRADFFPGDVTMADVFRMAPLGADPTTSTPGYTLVHVYMPVAALYGALDTTLGMNALGGSYTDYFVSPSGLRLKYDPTNASFNPADGSGGWITEMALVAPDAVGGADTQVLLDATGWKIDPTTTLLSTVTTYQVAAFALQMQVPLFADAAGTAVTSLEDLDARILHWPVPGSPTVKDHQALGRYLYGACAANEDQLPPIYDEATMGPVPRRVVCEGALATDGVCF